jgi:hypothetical protein
VVRYCHEECMFLVQKYILDFYWQYLVPSLSKPYVLRFEVLTVKSSAVDAFSLVDWYCCLQGVCAVDIQVRQVNLSL